METSILVKMAFIKILSDEQERRDDKRRDYLREWNLKNKSAKAVHAARYYSKNKPKIVAKAYIIYRNQCLSDPLFRKTRSLRSMITYRIKTPSACFNSIIGCDGLGLRAHMESLFKPNMNWDNYGFGEGKWCVDHIIPVSKFDQSDPEQNGKCWHFKNLQPLWFKENSVKHSGYPNNSA